jgi:apolipoprotein D and lipocalin family protein
MFLKGLRLTTLLTVLFSPLRLSAQDTISNTATNTPTNLETVPSVDLKRFAGKWYEIARLRKPWEMECALNTTYTFTAQTDLTMHVVEECQANTFFHKFEKSKGTATILDTKTHAKLKIEFSADSSYKWTFSGEYWIIQLADDYSYVVLADPKQTHLWILSRVSTIDSTTYQDILNEVTLQMPNVNVLNILPTEQNSDKTP